MLMQEAIDILSGPVGWALLAGWLAVEWYGGRMWAWWYEFLTVEESPRKPWGWWKVKRDKVLRDREGLSS